MLPYFKNVDTLLKIKEIESLLCFLLTPRSIYLLDFLTQFLRSFVPTQKAIAKTTPVPAVIQDRCCDISIINKQINKYLSCPFPHGAIHGQRKQKKKENDMSDEVRDSLLVDNLNVSDLLYFQHERYFQDANLQKAYL